ncbi:MAG: ATPase [Deltaproteobacteria bacterium]|nr:MAG: ATPase [Deltaproteobacteria bacterium]
MASLTDTLRSIDGASYGAFKRIRGTHPIGELTLHIDHVQGDPFAAPSRVRVVVPGALAAFPDDLRSPPVRAVALRDFLARRFAEAAADTRTRRGSGKSGLLAMEPPGQQVLDRTAVLLHPDGAVEARFTVGLPARGRRILGREANALLTEDIPALAHAALVHTALDARALRHHVLTVEDTRALRDQLAPHGLVAFVGNGAVLPRRSGVDPRPLTGPDVVPFSTPPERAVTLERPNAGPITGMGIPTGITLIVGGGYHGKSTLLHALAAGIHDHVPGDGREHVVTDPTAVRIRAEDGRRVTGVDISPFIGTLPGGRPTSAFTTDDASGSTSQAAAILEALEIGTRLLLMDEDTCATNFLIRDHRMQQLIASGDEPITPFLDKARQLLDEHGTSTLLVLGGSGDYFDIADHVLAMHHYRAADVTDRAHAIARAHPRQRAPEGGPRFGPITPRRPDPASIDPSTDRRDVRVRTRGTDELTLGDTPIDVAAVAGLAHPDQLEAIAAALVHARGRHLDGRHTLREAAERLLDEIDREGLDTLDVRRRGDLARFRVQDFAAVLNRLRTLGVESDGGAG